MSALTSLLARDQAVPVRKIEEALQKQVVSGGDIATVLLELEALPENTLSAYQAALAGVLPATRDEVMKVQRDTIRLVPREVAEKHRIVPLAVDGRALLVAVASPLPSDVESQIGFLLGYELVPRIVCEVRIAAGLQHHYGIEPSARHRRLIDKLRHREAGEVPYVAPPQAEKVSKASLGALPAKRSNASWLDDDEDDPPPPPPARKSQMPPANEGRTTDPNGFPRKTSVPPPAAEPVITAVPRAPTVPKFEPAPGDPSLDTSIDVAQEPVRMTVPGHAPPRVPSQAPRIEGAIAAPVLGVGVRRSSRPPPPAARPIATPASTPAPAPRPSVPSGELTEAQKTLRKLHGPLTASVAAKLLDTATGRDDVLSVLFAFARQFFDYAALFAITGDVAEGRDAFGTGATSDEVRRIAVPLDVPGRFAIVRRLREPTLEPMNTSELDALVVSDLKRPAKVLALLLPIALRERVVLVLYGDRAGDAFELRDLPELVAFVPRVVAALERIILKKKKTSQAEFQKPAEPEKRNDLKAAARAVGSLPPARPTRGADRWSAPPPADRTSAPSQDVIAPRSLVDVIASTGYTDARASEPPPPASPPMVDGSREASVPPAPSSASSAPPPSPDMAAMVKSPQRAAALRQMVGIPRSAPPPPMSDAADLGMMPIPGMPSTLSGFPTLSARALVPSRLPEPAVDMPLASGGRDTVPEGLLPIAGRTTEPAPPPSTLDDDEPEMVISSGDPDDFAGIDSSPDLDVEVEEPAKATSPGRNAPRETYLYKEAKVDVVASPRKSGSNRPPAARKSDRPGAATSTVGPGPKRRPDPRRESNDDVIATEEKVRVPTGSYSRTEAREGRVEKITQNIRPGGGRASLPPAAPTGRSVIVDMGDSVNQLVQDLVHAGPDEEGAIVEALLRLGDAPLPALAQAFPGPLWFDRRRPHRKQPRGRDVSAIARALFAYKERAVPYIATILSSAELDLRFYATMLANEMVHGGLVEALAARVFEDDEVLRKMACEALAKQRGLPEMVDALTVLRRTGRIRGKDPAKRLRAIAALGAIRDAGALRLLVDLLEDEDGAVVHAAHLALVDITCEDLGAGARKWAAWADRNESRHRIEWLIDALTHGDETLRTAAGEDLKAITQQYFGFHPGAGKKDREVVQQKYRTWWDTQGRRIHGMR
jgi:hypothetical protein